MGWMRLLGWCLPFDRVALATHAGAVRMMISLLVALVLLVGSPMAHAVQCLMAKPDLPAEWATMPADCPMFAMAMAEQGKVPMLSVADCVKAPALAQATVAVAEVEHLAGAALPMEGLALQEPPAMPPSLTKPPPDYGWRASPRSIVLLTTRLRP